MDTTQTDHIARIGFALGHPRRLGILALLRDRPETGRTLGHLEKASGLARGTLIHHLRQMESAGFVRRRQRGSSTSYILEHPPLLPSLSTLTTRRPQRDPASNIVGKLFSNA